MERAKGKISWHGLKVQWNYLKTIKSTLEEEINNDKSKEGNKIFWVISSHWIFENYYVLLSESLFYYAVSTLKYAKGNFPEWVYLKVRDFEIIDT